MFNQRQLGARVQLSKVYLIHEGSDKEDAAASAAQKVLRGQRVGKFVRIYPFSLVGD